jgi:ABC-2 type transport system ATP-binding protein
MLGLIRPTAGTVRLFGRDPQLSVRALEGVAGFVEAPSFYPYLSGRENLRLFAALDGGGAAERIEESLALVGLADRANDRVGGYSHGMRQRLGIAAALLRRPRLLLLDEPATGLDPGGMRDMRDLIRELSSSGMTVLLSSHLLAEVEELCNRVAIVRSGSVAYQGSLADLRAQAGESYLLRTTEDGIARRVAEAQAGISEVQPAADGGGLTFNAAGEDAVSMLSRALTEAGALILELARRHATLEDLFFSLTEGDTAVETRRESHSNGGDPSAQVGVETA